MAKLDHESWWPHPMDVAEWLREIREEIKSWGDAEIDVRFRMLRNARWEIKSGDAQYDVDHTGFWGASLVTAEDTDLVLLETANELIDEARENYRQAREAEIEGDA